MRLVTSTLRVPGIEQAPGKCLLLLTIILLKNALSFDTKRHKFGLFQLSRNFS